MEVKFLMLLLFAVQLRVPFTTSIFQENETDYLSLLSFKNQLSYATSGFLSSWNHTIHFCSWYGVSCGSRWHPQRVTALDLSSLGLSGFIPSSIANLTFLHTLALDNNGFYGTIPPEIGRLVHLQLANLSFNSLHGCVPANLTNCQHLSYLNLFANNLSGKVPQELGSLRKLTDLLLSNNSLTGGIPSSISNISSLQSLSLAMNQLDGSIPYEIGKLQNLQTFEISVNHLSGTLPTSLFNLSSLIFFGVADNQLEGKFPSYMGTALPYLQRIVFCCNHFSGLIPNSLSNASNLQHIGMERNNLSGKLPPNLGKLRSLSYLNLASNQLGTSDAYSWEFLTSLTNCSRLNKLELSGNKFGGELPNSIANLSTQLQSLRLDANNIFGNIHPGIENLVNLVILTFEVNLLSGSIPEGIGKLKRLQELYLTANRIEGNIPSSLGNLTQLVHLNLEKNKLNGPLPTSLQNLQKLEKLFLDQNRFSGIIPKGLVTLSSLRSYDLSYNSFVGRIPSELSSMKSLTWLYISGNKLTGEIPSALGDCQFLEELYLNHNHLQGNIPSSLGNLKGLQRLDLSQNNLSGPIPSFLQSLSLTHLNLSFNHFKGEVPVKAIFRNATAASLLGNDGLCGGIPEFHFPACPSKTTERAGRFSVLRKILPATASILLLIILISCVLIFRKTKLKREISSFPFSKSKYHRATYFELAKATDGFSVDNLIGVGSCGSVYKGSMGHANRVVAVKVFNLEVQGASTSFLDECEALRNIRHRNLVKIITSCSTIDSRGDEFKALVFEYMANGNLDMWLHTEKNLSLIQRLNIAIDVADALDYLHFGCDVPVSHCDLKPSNILLDDNMIAHVGDFGLARLLPEISEPLQDSFCRSGIRGTIGYVAPEYGFGGRASTCADVYSYGILLLEMFTGRRPVDDLFKDGLTLCKFVEMAFPDRVMDVIDSFLLLQLEGCADSDRIQTAMFSGYRIEECIRSVIKVGLSCSKDSPAERIDMRIAGAELHRIRTAFIEEEVY